MKFKKIALLTIASVSIIGVSSLRAESFNHYQLNIKDEKVSLIQDVEVNSKTLNEGDTINFLLFGQSNAKVQVVFNSSGAVNRTVALQEKSPGEYVGTYQIKRVDKLKDKSFDFTLSHGGKTYTAKYVPSAEKLINSAKVNPNYGVVKNIIKEEIKPNTVNGVHVPGAAIGAIAGGVIGSQIGGGSGQTAATILGAVGGGMLGNHIGKQQQAQEVKYLWKADILFDDGSTQKIEFQADPGFVNGDRVERKENNQFIKR